jgi:hypothetical protein
MDEKFKLKKSAALLIIAISGVSILCSLLFSDKIILREQVQVIVVSDYPKLLSYRKFIGKLYYWLKFRTTENVIYKLSESELKYTLYNDLMNTIKPFDTIIIKADNENYIHSLMVKGKSFINEAKVLQHTKDNQQVFLFCRAMICIACLPVLLFKNQPTFWYSGFEFELSFKLLFISILVIAVGIYFHYNGTYYLFGPDLKELQ